ncbi:hypothetical protein JYQ62_08355 [Nostoc sp. UHCC 0702]|nr:hypothetical protein JYQ62_08355 [Nostoc sp. UHCC 0702]
MTNPQETQTINVALLATQRLDKFIEFIKSVDPELNEIEAVLLAAEILDRLPQIFQSNPNLITSIQQACLVLKQNRVG